MDEDTSRTSHRSTNWYFFGTSVPHTEVVYLSQIILIFIVVIVSLVNLTAQIGDPILWSTTLGSSMGYVLPSPTIKRNTKVVTTTGNNSV